ncbi:MAG: hypothetical protein JW832_15070 [Deltaproteobacteria bacterium]|nr:hypothetical protein [Deltaproteobacteria bacterium]
MKTDGFIVILVIVIILAWNQQAMAQQSDTAQNIWYQNEIKQLLHQDRSSPPPQHAIVFAGSSIFRLWAGLARDMHPLRVVNRAFGGARTWEMLHYMDRLILPLKPAIIVFYCGGNDIEYGASASSVVQRFAQFCARAHEALPKTRIFFVSLNRAPQKSAKWSVIDDINRRAAALCARDERTGFIDINPGFFTADGRCRSELYISDGLHFMPEAYREMTRAIKPVLEKAWADIG